MDEILIRPYNPGLDAPHVHRIWTDSKWIDDSEMYPVVDAYHKVATVWLGEYGGKVGTVVSSSPGSFNYDGTELPMVAITGVTAGLEFRRLGLAGKTTVKILSEAAAEGAVIATLGAFEQGYYEKLGFGNFSRDTFITFDPHNLKTNKKHGPAIRLGPNDSPRMHAARLKRFKQHGTCDLHLEAATKFEMGYHKDCVCLGLETDGVLTHFFLATIKGEHGPMRIEMFVYQDAEQLLDLLSLLKTMSDQIRIVEMAEPLGIMMQEFLEHPMRHVEVTEGSKYANSNVSYSIFQARILDIKKAVEVVSLSNETLLFNLKISDPLDKYIAESESFKSCAGEYRVEFGRVSGISETPESGLPELECSINTFTRLWSGARSASSLVATDGLAGDAELIGQLDRLIRYPSLKPDWDF